MTAQRLHILNDNDIAALYAAPEFNATERSHFFALPPALLKSLKITKTNGKNTSAKLYFILQYGYFKAKHQFFNFSYQDVKHDVVFIMAQYFPKDGKPHQLPIRKTQRAMKLQIAEFMGFSDSMEKVDRVILEKTHQLAKTTPDLVAIFEEILHALETEKLILPKYSRLQNKLGAAMKSYSQHLNQQIKHALPKKVHQSLGNLLKMKEDFYAITTLQFDAKSFQTKEMSAEIDKLMMCQPIFDFAQTFLPTLALSRSIIDYYADLVNLYTVQRLQELLKETAYLYMMCYVYRRYERLMNNVTQGFAYYVDKYCSEGKKITKEALSITETPLEEHRTEIGKLMGIFTDKNVMRQSGAHIEKVAFKVMPEEEIAAVSEQLLHGERNRKRQEEKLIWTFHKENYQALLINLRPLFLAIDFTGQAGLKPLLKATEFLKKLLKKNKTLRDFPITKIPTAHIKPAFLVQYFTENMSKKAASKKTINPYQYEFYLYQMIRKNIKSSTIHVDNSIDYKSFEAEIKIPKDWAKQEEQILKTLNNTILSRPIDDTLTELKNILEPLIERTNRRALNGENKHINIKHFRDGHVEWTLPYPKRNIEIDNPFYDQLDIKLISEIYDFVAKETGFAELFTHIKPRGPKNTLDTIAHKGVIFANGTTHGTHAFSKLSNISYQRLQTAEQNNIRLATLRAAADKIVNCMINLTIFDGYDLSKQKHGSSDGSKKKTRRRVIKARHSTKYFGTDIGVVIMTMTLNHVPFSTRIISPNEHESHTLYPMVFQNTSLIDPDIISTDTAGTNNVNDFMYYLIGKTHAPCYRSTPRKVKTICGFKTEERYKDCLIKPESTVDVKKIKKYWPELVPILASILSHDVSQENVIKKLCSHDYKSEVKEAVWELNNILKSIHLLKYIDDIQYRRDIRTALNRGEAYHQLLKSIMKIGGGEFRGMSELEVEIWNECTRLIALMIIYYNMHLLSKLYDAALANKDTAAINFLKKISPVASQHLQLGGLYAFSETPTTINVDQVVEVLSKILEKNINTSLSS